MTIFLIILSLLVSLSGFLVSSKVRVETSFQDNKFSIKIYLMKIKIFDNTKKKRKKAKPKESAPADKKSKSISDILGVIIDRRDEIAEDVRDILKSVKKKAHIYKFYADLTFGVPDAADTGKLTGSLWSVVGVVFPVIDSAFTIDCIPEVNINPVFNNPCLKFVYHGNYSLRIFHILNIAKKILKKYKKYKGGVKNGSTSN